MERAWTRWAGALMLAATALLAACATSYKLDNTVQSFSSLPTLPANPAYKFERLPSQLSDPGQGRLEALADAPLFRAGLRRDDASPRYTVQVSAGVQRMVSPWADPWFPGYGWGSFGAFGHRRGVGLGMGFGGPFPRYEQPWFRREVAVLMREVASHKVVYESRAFNEGLWLDNDTVLTAMLDAAMQGFPNVPAGVRRVDVQINPK